MSRGPSPLGVRRFLATVDRPAMIAIAGLLLASLVTLFSVTHAPVPENGNPSLEVGRGIFWRQLVWIGIGLAALLVGYAIPIRTLEDTVWMQYTAVLGLLVLVLFMPHRMGAERWIILGPLQFQPSEIGKATVIFLLAHWFARRAANVNELRHMVMPCILVLV